MSASRREFLQEVGLGMLAASVGAVSAHEMGFSTARADEAPRPLHFGVREPLVAMMQETPIDRLIAMLLEQLDRGVGLRDLVAAGALANARTFGGEDYIGFHAMMAMTPALSMAGAMPEPQRALPVLKVLYRNSQRIAEKGGRREEVLRPVQAAVPASDSSTADQIRRAIHQRDVRQAERLLAHDVAASPESAYDDLLQTVEEAAEVHRTVLAYRAWDLLDVVGRENALTMLRQALHYCAKNCEPRYDAQFAECRTLLPKLLDEHRLHGKAPGARPADDAWIEALGRTIFESTPAQAAGAVAETLAEGFRPDDVAQAIAWTANQLVLRDPGRSAKHAQPNKPVGSVHGDSVGVHASDSANAWRNISQAAGGKNLFACLILSGWQAARDRTFGGAEISIREPWPYAEHLAKVSAKDPQKLLAELNDAIRKQDQARACAAVHAYGMGQWPEQPVVRTLLRYGVTQDGALHGEKYFRTATEEFSRARPRWRWRQLVALARVTASEYGQPAPGVEEAIERLKLTRKA